MKALIIFAVIIGIIVVQILIYFIFLRRKRDAIRKDWSKYKCRPYVMPLAGWMLGPKTETVTSNFKQCMWDINKTFFNILISPFRNIINLIYQILVTMKNSILNIRKTIKYMRESMKDFMEDTYNKIKSSYDKIREITERLQKILKYIFAALNDSMNSLTYIAWSFQSVWNGPIGGTARFFCFDEDTLIRINDYSLKKIKNIRIDNLLLSNNKVKGIMKFDAKCVDMYNYDNVIVSGSHLVYENNVWIRVENSNEGIKIENYDKPFIYCLYTDNSCITTKNNIKFRDYFEIDDYKINRQVYKIVLDSINDENDDSNLDSHDYILDSNNMINTHEKVNNMWGFHKDTIIDMLDGTTKAIKNISIGDNLKTGIVTGLTQCKGVVNFYDYNNIIVNGLQIVFDKKWIPIYNNKERKTICKYDKIIYNICTDTNIISSSGILFRDFEQTNSIVANEKIDELIINELNV
jgi:hypothetical protein